ncbi:hypothetical protein Leryth_017146 [Lithospermum erythrorhizon]|nr:hypothetical protein Leryth_017146 [Lithospermum erythrorhizon]
MEILKLPLLHLHRADLASWCNHRQGKFTVKHAYKLHGCMNAKEMTSSNSETISVLPTMDNLTKRKVNAAQDCKLCKYHKEDIMHVYLDNKHLQSNQALQKLRSFVTYFKSVGKPTFLVG